MTIALDQTLKLNKKKSIFYTGLFSVKSLFTISYTSRTNNNKYRLQHNLNSPNSIYQQTTTKIFLSKLIKKNTTMV